MGGVQMGMQMGMPVGMGMSMGMTPPMNMGPHFAHVNNNMGGGGGGGMNMGLNSNAQSFTPSHLSSTRGPSRSQNESPHRPNLPPRFQQQQQSPPPQQQQQLSPPRFNQPSSSFNQSGGFGSPHSFNTGNMNMNAQQMGPPGNGGMYPMSGMGMNPGIGMGPIGAFGSGGMQEMMGIINPSVVPMNMNMAAGGGPPMNMNNMGMLTTGDHLHSMFAGTAG